MQNAPMQYSINGRHYSRLRDLLGDYFRNRGHARVFVRFTRWNRTFVRRIVNPLQKTCIGRGDSGLFVHFRHLSDVLDTVTLSMKTFFPTMSVSIAALPDVVAQAAGAMDSALYTNVIAQADVGAGPVAAEPLLRTMCRTLVIKASLTSDGTDMDRLPAEYIAFESGEHVMLIEPNVWSALARGAAAGRLKELRFDSLQFLSVDGLALALGACKHLTSLELDQCGVDGAGLARLIVASDALPLLFIQVIDKLLTNADVGVIAGAVARRRIPLFGLELGQSSMDDEGLAALVLALNATRQMKRVLIKCPAGLALATAAAAVAMQNDRTGLECVRSEDMWEYPHVLLPAVMHSTHVRLPTQFDPDPARQVGRPWQKLYYDDSEWRLRYLFSSYRHSVIAHDDGDDVIVSEGRGAEAVVLGFDIGRLYDRLRPGGLRKLAVGHVDMSQGIPATIMAARRLKVLVLMNCGISDCPTPRQLRYRRREK
jgi:hypothetical protein